MAKVKDECFNFEIRMSFRSLQLFSNLLKLVINSHRFEMAQLFGIRIQATVGGEYQVQLAG